MSIVAKASQFDRIGTLTTTVDRPTTHRRPGRKASVALWIAQGLLALIFLAAGGMKLAMPIELLAQLSPLPALFLKFVATCEILGAIGLILPGLFRIRIGLTPLAAAGLVIIMIGATTSTIAVGQGPAALLPFFVGILAASVAYGRRSALVN
jgi:uncharacterized membrane protein YphA (DoxX/SURF4 family)